MTPAEVLAAIPQQPPFRFIDEVREVDDDHIVATYQFSREADFYRGHFPGRPVTPGVLLIESMAQAGVVALGIYLLAKQTTAEDVTRYVSLFTDASVEFFDAVAPGERVVVTARKLFFRHRKLRARVEMRREDGTLICAGVLSGIAR